MEQVTWIEVLGDGDHVVSRFRVTANQFTIGRAYDNDFIVDDSFVAAHHLKIEATDTGAFNVTDLNTINAVYLNKCRTPQKILKLDGHDVIRIGHTRLRFRNSNFSVPSELSQSERANIWVSLLLPLTLFVILSLLEDWSSFYRPFKWLHYVSTFLITLLIPLVWSSFWAILSKIFASRANFFNHIRYAVYLFLVLLIYTQLKRLISFSFSSTTLIKFDDIGVLLLISVFSFFHLRIASPTKMLWKAGILSSLYILTVSVVLLNLYGDPKILNKFDFVDDVEPPMLRLAAPQNENDFWQEVSALKITLDKARKDEPAADSKE